MIVALGALSIGTFLFAVNGGSSESTSASTAPVSITSPVVAGSAPDPVDVAAAQTCQAWDDYLSAGLTGTVPSVTGQNLLTKAEALLAGAKQDQAAGRALPKWTELAGDVLAGAQDVVGGNTEALRSDGGAIAAQCRMIPAAAAAAGGFRGSQATTQRYLTKN